MSKYIHVGMYKMFINNRFFSRAKHVAVGTGSQNGVRPPHRTPLRSSYYILLLYYYRYTHYKVQIAYICNGFLW